MKISIIIYSIFMLLIGILVGISIAEPIKHKCENEWWMRFGKSHLEVCDTIHERCFKRN